MDAVSPLVACERERRARATCSAVLTFGALLALGVARPCLAQCEIQKLSDGKPGAYFGYAVSVSGSRVALRCLSDVNPLDWSVCIFERSGAVWKPTVTLITSPSTVGSFGTSLDLQGDRLAIGAGDNAQVGWASCPVGRPRRPCRRTSSSHSFSQGEPS